MVKALFKSPLNMKFNAMFNDSTGFYFKGWDGLFLKKGSTITSYNAKVIAHLGIIRLKEICANVHSRYLYLNQLRNYYFCLFL